jgi:hypothetical protein
MISTINTASPLSVLEAKEFLRQYQERFLLVLFTFRRMTRPQVKAIWEFMLQRNKGEDDRALAELIERETGQAPPLGALAAKRFHLRQRLEVFRFFDEYRPGEPDLPGDESVVHWVAERRGVFEEDIPTLRKLIGASRAAHAEQTLGWAMVARACVDTDQDRPELVAHAQALITQASRDAMDEERRWARYQTWVTDAALRKKVSRLRNRAKALKCGFLLPSCWQLFVLCDKTEAEIISILRPAPPEVDMIKQIIGELR